DGAGLPFVAEPVHEPMPTTLLVTSLLADIDEPISDLAQTEIAATLADVLRSLGGQRECRPLAIDVRALQPARAHPPANASQPPPPSILAQTTGTDRFTLARHFRRAFGTSPDRYRTLRRLALARSAIENGLSLARAAAESGFADQSHMTRHFKRTYGLTPGRWTDLTLKSSQEIAPSGGPSAERKDSRYAAV